MLKECEICGKGYHTTRTQQTMCPECKQFTGREVREMRERKRRREQLSKNAMGSQNRILKVNQAASRFGVSYGKYMADQEYGGR